ncbi:hypothetical protein LshimejAT787_0210440 [Lyophyllum shimeji]|uniref:Uncharacterized protein n=1 Tax=Lyophyllum shimeji TaxID=47721 RepID=A0A9P3PHB1_LYOSH|nr:hypothetical protein LshimejAT787_0210440 [Lyophyllum shimeji]
MAVNADPFVVADVAIYERALGLSKVLMTLAIDSPLEDTKPLFARLLALFKADPSRARGGATPETVPHPKFWEAMSGIDALNNLLSRFPEEAPYQNLAFKSVCDAIIKHWDNVWKWVEAGARRAMRQKEHPLPEEHFIFLLSTLVRFAYTCSTTFDQQYQVHERLREKNYNALVDMSISRRVIHVWMRCSETRQPSFHKFGCPTTLQAT